MRRSALVVLLCLVVAACGGSGDADSGAEPTGATTGASQPDPGADTEEASEESGQPVPTASDGSADLGPQTGEHWHAAYGIYICDEFINPIPDDSDPEGIHTHGDGVIHIHPFFDSAAGENATMGKFFQAVGIDLTDEGFFSDGGTLEEGLECDGGPAEFRVARWQLFGLEEEPAVVDTGIADIRFLEDLEVYTLSMAPAGADIPLPPSISALGSISDVDPEDIPQLPAGFAVAVVDPPGPGESSDGETECPSADGSSPRITEFDGPPPLCIDPNKRYTATFVTNYGDVVVELDTATTPETVNNFVVLARYHYYDDTALFRTAPSIAIVQGGAPHSNSGADQGPGYTIADEADGFSYLPGDLAMARTPAPDSASAQFFFSTGPETSALDGPPGNEDNSGRGTYVIFGRTVEGFSVLQEIMSLHIDDARLQGGGPSSPVIVEAVVITEG